MNWDDSAYLVSKNRYSENSIIAEVFTENHGKISGIIFGGTSKKIKNYLQSGNKIYVNYNSKRDFKSLNTTLFRSKSETIMHYIGNAPYKTSYC